MEERFCQNGVFHLSSCGNKSEVKQGKKEKKNFFCQGLFVTYFSHKLVPVENAEWDKLRSACS